MPVSVHDVAAYILRKQGMMTTMKLQKLVPFAHASIFSLNNGFSSQTKDQAWL
jgi:uncharacterized phage-associated protein